jgi:hypothetical protein
MLTPPNSVQRTGALGVWVLPGEVGRGGRKTARPVVIVESRDAVRVERVGASA